MPEGERGALESPLSPAGHPSARLTSRTCLLTGGETLELAGITFEVLSVPGHSPATSPTTPTTPLLGRRPVRGRRRPHRPPRRRLGHAARLDPPARRALPARDGRLLRPRPADDPRRRARAQPVPRRAPRRPPVKFEAPRGTHDILPSEQPLWRRATGEIERLCALYGYRRIQTPVFEDTGLFARTSGQGSDIVQKEMYSFEDRGGRPLTLRPEGTAPICRAYLEHGMHRDPQPASSTRSRRCTGTPRRSAAATASTGRPRSRRSGPDPAVDAEIIQLYDTLLGNLGVTEYTLQLNSIGDRNCRPQYVEQLRAWLGRARPTSTRTRARSSGPARCGRSTTSSRSRRTSRRFCARRRRSRTRSATSAGPLRRRPRGARHLRRPLPARPDARPRARLLHAHDLGVRRAEGTRAEHDLRRRPLRLPRRGDRRPADARGRVRRRASSGCCSRWKAPERPRTRRGWTSSSSLDGGERDGGPRARARPPPPRRRRRPRLRRPLAQGPADAGVPLGRARTVLVAGERRARARARGGGSGRRARRAWPIRSPHELARPHVRRAPRGARRRARDRGRVGEHAAATTAASSSSTCATGPGSCQLVVNPEQAPDAAAAAHGIRNEFVLQAEGEVVRARPRT